MIARIRPGPLQYDIVTYEFAIVLSAASGVLAVRHEWLERETWILWLIRSREHDAFRRSRTSRNNVEVKAMRIDLYLALEALLLKFRHVAVQCDQLGSQDIRARLDVAGKLDFVTIAIIGSNLVGPFVCFY
jgi:hypothetical protein